MHLRSSVLVLAVCLFVCNHLVIAQTTSSSLRYEELVSLNVSCPPKDTCAREYSKTRELPSLNERNCACDDFCAVYGDCCIDATARISKPVSPSETMKGWLCRNMTQFEAIIMKNSCPANWSGSEEVQRKCESHEGVADSADPLSVMPVTNRMNGATYLNIYCAFCNSDTAHSLIWTPRLEFDRLDKYNRTFYNITYQYVLKNIVYLKENASWGIYLNDLDGLNRFYSAKLYPFMPKEVEALVRPCRKSLISTCDETWPDVTIRDKCSSYEAAIYLRDLSKPLGFRNPHCAICNYIDTSRLTCKSPSAKSDVEQRTFNFQAFSLLVDFSDAKGKHVGRKELCFEGEIYDPFQKKCRDLFCGFPGYVLINKKCVLEVPRGNVSTTPFATSNSSSFTFTTDLSTLPSVPTEAPQSNITSPEYTVQPIEPNTYGTITTEENTVRVVTVNFNVSSTTNIPRTRVNSKTTRTEEDTSLSPPSTSTALMYREDFMGCSKVPHSFDDVDIFPNGTIYVIPYDMYYHRSEYLFSDNQVWVCAFFINNTAIEVAKFSLALGYITIVGLSISVVCLILHLAVFVCLPDLQNLSTKNLSSFAVALLFAYLCFTVGNIKSLSNLSCTFIAIAMCYFFLVTFFWMNTMAFDVWRTLRLATRELRVSSGRQCKRFILYSAYAWGVPSAIISIALLADNLEGVPKGFKPGFGVKLCWFSERNSLLVFFAAPLMIVILTNIGFFVSSAKMIISTSQATSTNHSASSRRNFKLYLRLAVMMGLTWIFGIVAGYLDLETLWYIFVILNTLQGLFIFVAFTCNRKVRKHFIDRCKSVGKSRQSYRTTSLNSGSGLNYHSGFPMSKNVNSRTNLTQLGGSKTSLVSEKCSQVSSLTSTPARSMSPFKQLQAGMETLY